MLHYACQYGYINIVSMLIKKLVYLNCQDDKKRTPLHYAVDNYHINIVKLLLQQNVHCHIYDINYITPLMIVSPGTHGHLLLFDMLLPYSDINFKSQNKTLLYHYVEQNDFLGVQFMLQKGADPYIPCLHDNHGVCYKYYVTPLKCALLKTYNLFDDVIKQFKIIKLLQKYML